MPGLVPFNRRSSNLTRTGTGIGYDNFYNMLDDFFSDNFFQSGRNLTRDTFKIDIEDKENEYIVEAEIPGVPREAIDLGIEDDILSISVSRVEETNDDGKNYIHRERRATSMSRRIRLADANLNEIKAKLESGVLTITIPKDVKGNVFRKIDIE